MRVQPTDQSKPFRRRQRADPLAIAIAVPSPSVNATPFGQRSFSSPRHFRGSVAVHSFLSVLLLLFVLTIPESTEAQGHEPQCKPQEPTKYDWERLNYYELLGLAEKKDAKKKKKKKRGTPNAKTPATTAGTGTVASASASKEEGSAISSKEIRKAYRKQAQKYHPDKQLHKKKSADSNKFSGNSKPKPTSSTSTSASTSTNTKVMSLEESNARFAKIAEAYEFLLDDSKRKDYDLFLEYCQNTEILKDDDVHEGRLSTMLKKRFNGLFDNLVGERDPFRVFKDVFFGGDSDGDDAYFDPNDPFAHLRYENNPQRHPNHQHDHPKEEPYEPEGDPLVVFHEKHAMYDPVTGENVIRVLQTEEYAPSSRDDGNSDSKSNSNSNTGSTRGGNANANANSNSTSSSSSSFYYRIIAQDFEERYDPYNAKQVYVPITEPYLQEDGFRKTSASRDQAANSKSSSSSASANVESILHPWEVLTPRSPPIVSPNKRYIAGLSPDCELLVMINPDRFVDDENGRRNDDEFIHWDAPPEVLWSTQRPYGKDGYVEDHCFALLKGPHLVVTVGQHPQQGGGNHNGNNRILWHSDGRSDEDDSKHGYYEYEDEFGFWHKRQRSYLAQLDNDGSLTVYSVWSVPQDPSDGHGFFFNNNYNSVGQPLPRSKALVASVANAARDLWHGRIPTRNDYDHLYSTSRSLTYKRCVYSTLGGNHPLLPQRIGCSKISRRFHQLTWELALVIRKWVFKVNLFADAWLDLIYEEDDIFFSVKESLRIQTGSLGSKMGSSARWVRKLMEGLKR